MAATEQKVNDDLTLVSLQTTRETMKSKDNAMLATENMRLRRITKTSIVQSCGEVQAITMEKWWHLEFVGQEGIQDCITLYGKWSVSAELSLARDDCGWQVCRILPLYRRKAFPNGSSPRGDIRLDWFIRLVQAREVTLA